MNESSISDLYDSAVKAFPKTTLRQHATHPIVITKLSWTPFLGMKTLFVKGLAQNEGKEYNPMILFKGVNYNPIKEAVRLQASDGMPYRFEKLSFENSQVALRCNCLDFRYRFSYYNHLDEALYGRKPVKYTKSEGSRPVNPLELPGMCKHLIKLVKVLEQANIFKELVHLEES